MPQQIGLEAILDLGNFNRGAGEYNRTIAGMNTNTDRASGGMSKGLQGVGTVAMGVGKVVGGAAILAGVGIGGMAVSGVKAATSLEQSVANIRSVFSGVAPDIQDVKDLILDLGVNPNLKVTGEEAAAVLEMLARNGLTWTEVMGGAAEGSIILANATGADFGTAANIATDAMAIFGIEAADMLTAVDGITSVVTNSKFGISDYALALAQGGGVAQTVGVEFDDFNASIAAMSPLFASGSDAGTSFKTFLLRLTPDTDKAVAAMKELGIMTAEGSNQFFDAQGNIKPMAEIAGILGESLSDLSEQQKSQALSTIFGTDAMRAASGLASLTEVEFAALQTTMADTSAADAVALRMDTLQGTLEILGGVLDALKTKLGDSLLPALQLFADKLTELVSSEEFSAFIDNLALGLTETLPAAITATTAALQLASGDWAAAFETLGISVEEAKAAVAEVDWVGEASTAATDLATGFSENASSVIDEVVIMLDEMTTAILEADWDTVGSEAMGVLLAGMEAAMTDIDWEGLGKKIITELIPGLFRAEIAIRMAVTKLLRGALTQAVQTANPSKAGENIVIAIAKGIPILEAQIKDALTDALEKAKKAAGTLAKDFVSIGEDIVGGILKGLGNKIGAFENWIKTNLIDKIPAWAREGLSIGSPSKVFAEIGVNVAEGFIVGIQSKIKDTDEAIKAMVDVGSKFSGFASFFSGLIADPNLQLRIDQLTQKVGRFAATANDVAGVDLGKLNSIELAKTKDALQQMSGLLNDPVLNGSIGNPFADLLAQFNSSALRDGLADKLTTSGELADLNQESITAILTSISMQENLNDLLAEQAAEEEKIAKIKQKQADLAFLQQQLDLVKLVKDADLPFEAEVFKGIEFGLGADPADILSATVAAMDAIIQQSSAGLAAQVDNSAPAQEVITETIPALNALTVGFKGAAPLLDAMVVGFKGAAPVVDAMIVSFKGAASALHGFGGFRGSAPVSGIVSGLGGAGGAGATNNSRNATVSLTFNPTINNGMDMNQFTNQVTQAVSGALATG